MAYGASNGNFAFSPWHTQFVFAFWAFVIFVGSPVARFHLCIFLRRVKMRGNPAQPVPERTPPAEEPFVLFPALGIVARKHPVNAEDQREESQNCEER